MLHVVHPAVRSPWYLVQLAQHLTADARKAGQMGNVPIPFEQWVLWHAARVIPPQTGAEMLAHVEAAIRSIVQ